MKQISPYEVLQREVDKIASQVTNPETEEFSDFFVSATAVLSAYGNEDQSRNSIMCGYAIRSLDEVERADFMSCTDLPGRVYMELATPSDWPEFEND